MKIGLIGVNSIKEEVKFEFIQQTLKNNLFALFSPHFDDMHIFARRYNINVYSTANNLFMDVDAIYFANSLKPNIDFAIQALKNSCHLFIEDISELMIEEIKQLYKLAFEARVRLVVKETILFTPEFKFISEKISTSKIVELEYLFNRLLRKQDYFYETYEAVRVVSACIRSGIKKINTTPVEIEPNLLSLVFILLEFDNGAIAKIKLNNLAQENDKKIEIYETGNFFEINFTKHYAYKNSFIKGHTERKKLKLVKIDAFKSEIENFIHQSKKIKSINISESPQIIEDIKATQLIIQKIYN
ncbi:MAG TPA: Gfo/Idh/MocA family oxidoreductase [Bacteroidales bacterium]|nr:Gfo/Idh/MocA family oxidoreductase [Bacteroidales bacterium]